MKVAATSHVHSTWSYDGSWSLPRLATEFRKRGSRVLMMTEHDRGFSRERLVEFRHACADVTTDDLYVLPGIEYSDADNRVHVLVWGDVPFLGEGLPTERMLRAVAEHGGVAVLAHPDRRHAWECVKSTWTELLSGIEAWNRKYDGWAPGRTAANILKDSGCAPFVGLDFHTARQFFPLTMHLDVEGVVSEASVVACIQARRLTAHAFASALSEDRFRRQLPLLRVAEFGRSHLAAVRRFSTSRRRAASRGAEPRA